jgi:hypothetical protein
MSLILLRTQASSRDYRHPSDRAGRLLLVIDQPTVPPFASQAAADSAGRNPWPLQEFWPLHALLAVLQALWPLQALIPMHSTLAIFLAEAVVTDAPFMASAIAAMARLVPEAILYFMLISLGNGSRTEPCEGLQASPQLLFVAEP